MPDGPLSSTIEIFPAGILIITYVNLLSFLLFANADHPRARLYVCVFAAATLVVIYDVSGLRNIKTSDASPPRTVCLVVCHHRTAFLAHRASTVALANTHAAARHHIGKSASTA